MPEKILKITLQYEVETSAPNWYPSNGYWMSNWQNKIINKKSRQQRNKCFFRSMELFLYLRIVLKDFFIFFNKSYWWQNVDSSLFEFIFNTPETQDEKSYLKSVKRRRKSNKYLLTGTVNCTKFTLNIKSEKMGPAHIFQIILIFLIQVSTHDFCFNHTRTKFSRSRDSEML